MNEENRGLKEMIEQVSSNYNTLEMQLFALMRHSNRKTDRETIYQTSNKVTVPKQFMDLGEKNEQDPSQSSSEGRTISEPHGDGGNENIRARCREDERSDHGSQPRLVPAKIYEQAAEATMRKVRVSVRARSEASMVINSFQNQTTHLVFYHHIIVKIVLNIFIQIMNRACENQKNCRSVMDANGESMDRKWPRGIPAPVLTIVAPWPLAAQFANRSGLATNSILFE